MPQIVNDEESLAKKETGKLHVSRNSRLFREHLKKINIISTITVILVAVVLITASVLFVVKVSSDMDGYVEDEAESVMSNFSDHIGEDVSTNLNSWYSQLEIASEAISSLTYSPDNVSAFDNDLQTLADTVKFEKFGIILNTEYDGCEAMLYVSQSEEYGIDEALIAVSEGRTYIGEITIDGERHIVLAVPFDGDNLTNALNVEGVAGILDPDDFADFLKTAVFSEQSYLVVVDSKGGVVATGTGTSSQKTYTGNLLTDFENYFGLDFETLNKLSGDLGTGNSGIIKYTSLGVEYFMYYTPISESLTADLPTPVSSWRIVMIVEASAISEGMVSELNNIKATFVGVMSIALIVMLVFIIAGSRGFVRNQLLKYTDPVTGSINQQRFAVDAQNLLDGGKHKYVLASLNVRHFKLINEEHGREKADALLAEILNYIDSLLGEDELVARGYADRYLLLLTCDNESAENKVERLYDSLIFARFMKSEGEGVNLKFVIGAYKFGENGAVSKITDATDRARLARVQDNQSAGGRAITYFSDDMLNVEKQESEMENRAELALKNGDFVVFYQPKCNIQSGKWSGAEALVRWKDPEQGMIPPGKFIPLFERNGMVVELDKYVFERVCMDMRKSLDKGYAVVPVSVNLSREHFKHENFFKEYEEILARYDVPHKYIEFEITESLAMEREDDLKKLIERIHEIGCRCSIDDFGSGYSSLNMLHDYNFDVIKLDGKFFMSDDGFGTESKKIVSSLIRLFHDLDKEVVAEGVETRETVEILREDGCDTVQGYYFSRPVPYDEFVQKLSQNPFEK